MTTYKELSSLASELGKPELMYKFMNLAFHNQIWTTRKSAAFATTTLASTDAKEYLRPYLDKLIPKLYRNSYDPNPRIAQSMNTLLNSLIENSASPSSSSDDEFQSRPGKIKIFDLYWDGIIKEIMDGLGIFLSLLLFIFHSTLYPICVLSFYSPSPPPSSSPPFPSPIFFNSIQFSPMIDGDM